MIAQWSCENRQKWHHPTRNILTTLPKMITKKKKKNTSTSPYFFSAFGFLGVQWESIICMLAPWKAMAKHWTVWSMMTGPCEAHGERGECTERDRERGCGEKGEEEEGTGQRREGNRRGQLDLETPSGEKMLRTRPSKLTVSHLSQSAKHSHSPRTGLMWDIGQCSITLNTLSQKSTFFSILHDMCGNESLNRNSWLSHVGVEGLVVSCHLCATPAKRETTAQGCIYQSRKQLF